MRNRILVGSVSWIDPKMTTIDAAVKKDAEEQIQYILNEMAYDDSAERQALYYLHLKNNRSHKRNRK